MNLRGLAESDLSYIFDDGSTAVLLSPAGAEYPVVMISNDISEGIDPGTGQLVTGRYAYALLRMSMLPDLPKGIAESGEKPWRLRFVDLQGVTATFKIVSTRPDRTLGLVKCELQAYVN